MTIFNVESNDWKGCYCGHRGERGLGRVETPK
jgi:hypothetical protein